MYFLSKPGGNRLAFARFQEVLSGAAKLAQGVAPPKFHLGGRRVDRGEAAKPTAADGVWRQEPQPKLREPPCSARCR